MKLNFFTNRNLFHAVFQRTSRVYTSSRIINSSVTPIEMAYHTTGKQRYREEQENNSKNDLFGP